MGRERNPTFAYGKMSKRPQPRRKQTAPDGVDLIGREGRGSLRNGKRETEREGKTVEDQDFLE